MKTIKKLQKTHKCIFAFIKQTIRNYKSMKNKISKIWALFALALFLASCGSTKVAVDRPAAGTQTTITVTTNNPITTNVEPQTNATLWDKK